MRMPARCHECSIERARQDGAPVEREVYLLDLEDDGAYLGRCDHGHEIRVALQNLRYEILYESGIMALHVGFHREAVASIASALERFYEFTIRVFLAHLSVPEDAVTTGWSLVANQSERQLGALAFLHLGVLKKAFVVPNKNGSISDVAKFRNDVVHKGRLPTRVESIEYARHVFDIVLRMRDELVALDNEATRLVALRMGAFTNRQALEKKAGPPKPNKDGQYHSGGGTAFVMTMLSEFDGGRDKRFARRFVMSATRLDLWGLDGMALRAESDAVRRALGMCDHRLCRYRDDYTRCSFRDVDPLPGAGHATVMIPEERWAQLTALWDQLKASPNGDWSYSVATELAACVRDEVSVRLRANKGLLEAMQHALEVAFGEKGA